MPGPAHARLTFSGVFGSPTSPAEIWAFNLSAPPQLPAIYTAADTGLTAIVNAYGTHIRPLMGTDVTLTNVRIAALEPSGRVGKSSDGSFKQKDVATTQTGSVGIVAGSLKPLSTALCVSLTTTRAGAMGKGRFFLPWPQGTNLGTDYRIDATASQSLANSAKAFLNAIKIALSSDLVVSSGGSLVTGEGPALSVVTGVRVGRVPDTMRSRRSALIEGYSTATL